MGFPCSLDLMPYFSLSPCFDIPNPYAGLSWNGLDEVAHQNQTLCYNQIRVMFGFVQFCQIYFTSPKLKSHGAVFLYLAVVFLLFYVHVLV